MPFAAAIQRLALTASITAAATAGWGSTVTVDSEPFVFDTRDARASAVAASPAFLVDTRVVRASAVGDSAAFAFDTRGTMGESSAGISGLFAFDTRTGRALSLAIGGPSECEPGGAVRLQCWAHCDDGTVIDAAALCDWWIDGVAPPGTAVGGGQFTAGSPSVPTTVRVRAGYLRPEGYLVAAPFEVTIAKTLGARLESLAVRNAGAGAWDLDAQASVDGAYGGTTWQWQLDGAALAGAGGAELAGWRVTGAAGTRLLTATVTDGQGRRATAARRVVFDKPPVEREPPQRVRAADPVQGTMLDVLGAPFVFHTDRKAT